MNSSRRTSYRVHAQVSVSANSAHNFFTGFTTNISEGGLFVSTYQLKPVGTEIGLTLKLEGGPEMEVVGTVRWVRDTSDREDSLPPGMGLQFTNLDEEGQARINDFINYRRESIFYDLD
jgi:uncharacterized protein (TIGR02266 family)